MSEEFETDKLKPEFRSAGLVDAEMQGMNFRGYAAVFDSPWNKSLIERMGYVESIARGAFRKALTAVKNGDYNVPLTWQHDRNAVLATTRSGNLSLREDGKGLLVEARLPDTTLGRDVREMIERGDVRGMSYGIESMRQDSNVSRKNGVMHRSIANVRRLIDTTLTWEPTYDETTVELRSLSGFTALPLQALIGGSEEQTDDAASESSSLVVSPYQGRMADVLINELEKGGWPL
jgi:HK97 family phage prohead protease